MNDPGNAQPPAAGWLFPHEWQEPGEPMNGVPGEPMNGAFDDESPYVDETAEMEYQAFFTVTTRQQATKLIERIEARGIECRIQGLVDCDQVCVHLNGNNAPAAIYSPNQFLAWAPTFLKTEL